MGSKIKRYACIVCLIWSIILFVIICVMRPSNIEYLLLWLMFLLVGAMALADDLNRADQVSKQKEQITHMKRMVDMLNENLTKAVEIQDVLIKHQKENERFMEGIAPVLRSLQNQINDLKKINTIQEDNDHE